MTGLNIRRAKLTDLASLTSVFDAAYAEYRRTLVDLPEVSKGLSQDIQSHVVFVATLDENILGGLVLVMKKSYALLANVAVSPDASGKGVGRQMIEAAERYCISQNRNELRLTTHTAMPDNLRLYEHLGWKQTDQSGNKVYMTKSI